MTGIAGIVACQSQSTNKHHNDLRIKDPIVILGPLA